MCTIQFKKAIILHTVHIFFLYWTSYLLNDYLRLASICEVRIWGLPLLRQAPGGHVRNWTSVYILLSTLWIGFFCHSIIECVMPMYTYTRQQQSCHHSHTYFSLPWNKNLIMLFHSTAFDFLLRPIRLIAWAFVWNIQTRQNNTKTKSYNRKNNSLYLRANDLYYKNYTRKSALLQYPKNIYKYFDDCTPKIRFTMKRIFSRYTASSNPLRKEVCHVFYQLRSSCLWKSHAREVRQRSLRQRCGRPVPGVPRLPLLSSAMQGTVSEQPTV